MLQTRDDLVPPTIVMQGFMAGEETLGQLQSVLCLGW